MSHKVSWERCNVQNGNFHLDLEGDISDADLASAKKDFEKNILDIASLSPNSVVVRAADAAICSDAMLAFAELIVKNIPKECRVVYEQSQLMMCLKYDDDYTNARPFDVFMDW